MAESGEAVLDLSEALAGGGHRFSPNVWAAWREAAAVMFERFHGAPPPPHACVFAPVGHDEVRVTFTWPTVDDTTRTSQETMNATEQGAYVVACVAVNHLGGWRVVGRASHGSGADLIMLPPGVTNEEEFVRLEVSGIAEGTGRSAETKLTARLRTKLEQLGRGDLDRPGVAVVVGFALAKVLVSEVQQ